MGEKWIGRFGPIHYPARSTDPAPIDFFHWDALKQRVYSNDMPLIRELLTVRIREAINALNEPHIIRKVYDEFIKRAEKYVEVGGS